MNYLIPLLLAALLCVGCSTKKTVVIDPSLHEDLASIKERETVQKEEEKAAARQDADAQAKQFLAGKKVHVPALGLDARPISGSAAIEAAVKAYDATGQIDPIITGVNHISFPYGLSPAKMACSKLRVCSIGLQEGEQVLDIVTGDTQRWNISVARTGDSANQRPMIMVKPLSDGALETNLIITTNRRVYDIDMVSVTSGPYTPQIDFYYPHEPLLPEPTARYAKTQPVAERSVTQASLSTLVALDHMQFRYKIEGDEHLPWYPARVFDDGMKVYIQMPQDLKASEVPVFLIQDGKKQEIANYRYQAPYYVIDRLFKEGILILGTDTQQDIVTISKIKGR